jgi:MYXO-CTERM domain-containing protein
MTKMSAKRFVLGFVSALVVSLSVQPKHAQACGGLFCSASAPVNQAAERIIFSKNADGTVTAVVQIQYQGPSEEFAWVLPVPGIPDVKVSSDLAFTRLQLAGNPQYSLSTVIEGECLQLDLAFPPGGVDIDSSFEGAGGAGGAGGGGVNVLARGNVGPYDYVVIQPEGSFEHVGDVMVEWLTNEGYDVVPPGGDPADISDLLGSYLEGGMNLIAFRLTKGNNNGTIRPIRITYASDQPMIPIRPTAVAANDDMGVLVWVLGESRAVPVNYRSLELNEALIDWINFGSNYNQVVVAAANEAGGQGFVTERAVASDAIDNVVVTDFEREQWEQLQVNEPALSSEELLRATVRFSGWDGYLEVLEDFLPQDDLDLFIQCPQCDNTLTPFDKEAFINALASDVIAPMLETDELLASRPYVTRLYTTLSAPEMDLDPLFDFNADLDDVSKVHNAMRVFECNPTIFLSEAPSRIELEDGRVVRVPPGGSWPFTAGDEDAPPANAIVAQLSTSGPGTVVTDNNDAIDAALDEHNARVPALQDPVLVTAGGCAVTPHQTDLLWWVGLALAGLLVRRRRSGGLGGYEG